MTYSRPAFKSVRLREGYDIDEVDRFLNLTEPRITALRGPDQRLADEIRNARFRPVRLTRGYDMGEVDAYLDELQRIAGAAR